MQPVKDNCKNILVFPDPKRECSVNTLCEQMSQLHLHDLDEVPDVIALVKKRVKWVGPYEAQVIRKPLEELLQTLCTQVLQKRGTDRNREQAQKETQLKLEKLYNGLFSKKRAFELSHLPIFVSYAKTPDEMRRALLDLCQDLRQLFREKKGTEQNIEHAQDKACRRLEQLQGGLFPVARAFMLSHNPKFVHQAEQDTLSPIDIAKSLVPMKEADIARIKAPLEAMFRQFVLLFPDMQGIKRVELESFQKLMYEASKFIPKPHLEKLATFAHYKRHVVYRQSLLEHNFYAFPHQVQGAITQYLDIHSLHQFVFCVSKQTKELFRTHFRGRNDCFNHALFRFGYDMDRIPVHLKAVSSSMTQVAISDRWVDESLLQKIVTSVPNLQQFSLRDRKNFTVGCIKLLTQVPITDLNLFGTKINDKILHESIPTLRKLQKLNLGRCVDITSRGLQCLAELENLIELDLTFTDVDDQVLQDTLPRLYKLQRLDLSNTQGYITASGMKSLAKLTNLVELHLSSNKRFDDKILKACSSLGTLRILNLAGCGNITTSGMKSLVKLTNLVELNLSETEVDYPTLQAIIPALTYLRRLKIYSYSKVGAQGIRLLREAHPRLIINE